MTFYLKIFPTSGKYFPAPHRCIYLLADGFYCVLQQKKPHLEYIWTGLVIIIFLLEQNENCCSVLPRGGVCSYDRCGGSLPCGQMLDIPGNRTRPDTAQPIWPQDRHHHLSLKFRGGQRHSLTNLSSHMLRSLSGRGGWSEHRRWWSRPIQ